jgi:hypothetical protein
MLALKEKRDLSSFYPEDIFHFINMQLDILSKKLKGEVYMEYLRTLADTLKDFLLQEKQRIVD